MNSAASSSDRHNLSLLRVFGQLLLSLPAERFHKNLLCGVQRRGEISLLQRCQPRVCPYGGKQKKTSSKIVALSFFFIVYNQYDQHIPLLLK
jgi:hypothetical protein